MNKTEFDREIEKITDEVNIAETCLKDRLYLSAHTHFNSAYVNVIDLNGRMDELDNTQKTTLIDLATKIMDRIRWISELWWESKG